MQYLATWDAVLADSFNACKRLIGEQPIRARSASEILLLRYSPDFDPIKMSVRMHKSHLKKRTARPTEVLWRAIGQISYLYNQEECLNRFKAARYSYA